ncbi:MAG: glutaminyl-peptide cyclotransferase, partial [Candidatus Fermentibacter sp.]|nr:glutaminyl-peptide cyclotransferase [Candidatus Fermentibacter sp.]
ACSTGRRTFRFGGPFLLAAGMLLPHSMTASCSGRPDPAPFVPADTVSEAPGFKTAKAIPVDTLYHDSTMYTQGLCFYDGDIYESSGGYGSSWLRRLSWPSMDVLGEVVLPREFFAEGLAIVDDTLCLLTWREGVAFRYTVPDLEPCGFFTYEGEGWGLTAGDGIFYMSDGGSTIQIRDPSTFAGLGRLQVTVGASQAMLLNELEYRDGILYANQWGMESILEIDVASGSVVTVLDASALLDRAQWPGAEVLNGIAFDPEGRMLLTGKHWPFCFLVIEEPAAPPP